MYSWFYTSVATKEIHFENIDMSYFKDGVIHIAVPPNQYLCLTDSFFDPELGGGLMDALVLFIHEARHAQVAHWDGTNDHSIAEPGAWGVQYYMYQYLADRSNFFIADWIKERLVLDAEALKQSRSTDEPQ